MTALQALNISKIIIGSNVFGWTLNQEAAFKILDALFEQGFNTFDTANVYSAWVPGNQGGESEAILGQWMKDRKLRDQIVIITKVGMPVQGQQGLAKDYVLSACDASLQRLQTDYIDVYLSHKEDPNTPIADTLQAYQTLLEQQKVRLIGGSNYSFDGLKASVETAKTQGLTPYQVYQPEYNLYERAGFEHDYQAFCQANDIAVIPYYALASGFLTGKYRAAADASQSQRGGGVVNRYLNARGEAILQALDTVAQETNSSPAAVALAWLMVQPTIAAPIASVTKAHHIDALSAAVSMVLSPAQQELLAQASQL